MGVQCLFDMECEIKSWEEDTKRQTNKTAYSMVYNQLKIQCKIPPKIILKNIHDGKVELFKCPSPSSLRGKFVRQWSLCDLDSLYRARQSQNTVTGIEKIHCQDIMMTQILCIV